MDPKTGEVQVARDVKLFEYERCEKSVFNMEEDDQEIFYHESFKNDGLDSGVEIERSESSDGEYNDIVQELVSDNESIYSIDDDEYNPSTAGSNSASSRHDPDNAEMPRRSTREKKPSKQYDDYIVFTASVNGIETPSTIAEALSGPQSTFWKQAIQDELDSIKQNQTWTLVDLPKNKRPIKCKWVFKITQDVDGKPKYKAWLVAKGYSQQAGVDYQETYAPVVRRETLRLLFALAIQLNLDLDIKTAFLNGSLSEDIFMYKPEGC
jgi:hypothetical protein